MPKTKYYTDEEVKQLQEAWSVSGYEVKKASDFIKHLKLATTLKSLYVNGCWGAPMNEHNKKRWIEGHSYNAKEARKKKINACTPDVFGFDCCNLVKGCLWNWRGLVDDPEKSASAEYGGARYGTNGMSDTTIYNMLNKYCTDISDDFSNIQPGEFVVYDKEYSHCGAYIGDGLIIESTPIWDDGAQVTECWNVKKTGEIKGRSWWKHGKLKMLDYDEKPEPVETDFYYIPLLIDLKSGDKGEEVAKFQRRLRQISTEFDKEVKEHSFNDGKPDGKYGPKMTETVKKFQKQAGLEATGVLNVETRAVLNQNIAINNAKLLTIKEIL